MKLIDMYTTKGFPSSLWINYGTAYGDDCMNMQHESYQRLRAAMHPKNRTNYSRILKDWDARGYGPAETMALVRDAGV